MEAGAAEAGDEDPEAGAAGALEAVEAVEPGPPAASMTSWQKLVTPGTLVRKRIMAVTILN